MWFKGEVKSENTVTQQNRTAPAEGNIENLRGKRVENPRADAAHRQPLAAVDNRAQDRHRPPEVEASKPAKAARVEPASVPAVPESVVAAPAAPTGLHVMPNLVARRAELGFVPADMDIDSQDVTDPMFCSTYVQEVYDYLRQKEVTDQIDFNYMRIQPNITPRMRMVLVDWMVEVQLKFRMTAETLYLSVNIVDKYLQRKAITRDKLQLLGVTALHIASKFEEIYSIDIQDFVFICDSACSAADIIAFENEVLHTIHWCLTTPYPLHFLRRYSKAAGNDGLRHTMSKYLLELSLGFYHMLKYLPSTQAAAAVLLARHLIATPPPFWPDQVKFHSCYRESEILDCARDMLELVLHPDPKYRLVSRKYGGSKFCSVAHTALENAPRVKL